MKKVMFNIGKFVNNLFGLRVREQTTATDDMMLGDDIGHHASGYHDGYHAIGPVSRKFKYLKGWNQGLLDVVEQKPYQKQFNSKEPNMTKTINPAPPHPEMPKAEVTGPPYTIGILPDGRVQFQMTYDYTTTTLTMGQAGVIDLIEDLAHAIRKDYSVVIIPEDQEADAE
jgi:hypothetical protein